MSGLEPILIGAAVGAGTSAVFGGDPLKGALLGGATGGLGGAGGLFGGAKGAGAGLKVTGAAASAPGSLLSQPIANVAPIGFKAPLDLGISAVTPASLVDDAILSTAQPMNATAAAMGGGFKLPANAAEIVGQNPSIFDNLREYMPSGRDLAGLGLQSAMQPRPTVQAPAGGITQGRAPDVAAIQNLVSSMRRKPPEGILGDYFG
jgi:hypothetical protein